MSLSHLSHVSLSPPVCLMICLPVSNTLLLLIELRALLKKPASETTYLELLVLAFRVFEFQRSKVENSEEVQS